jgi:hypothetical protein
MKKATTLAILALAFAIPAIGAPMGQGPMMQGQQGMMMRGMCGMGSHVEGSLAYLKTELKITGAQTAPWDAFAAAFREAKGQGGQMEMMMPDGMMMGPKNAPPLPERMARHRAMMEAHLAQMAKMQPAVEKLYGALSPEQKRTADEIMPMFVMCRMM